MHASSDGVFDVFDHMAGMGVRIREHFSKVINRTGRNAGGENAFNPLLRCARSERAFDFVNEGRPVRHLAAFACEA